MLEAAVAMVHRSGLTVSLDHISLEEVIRDAGVSRSAVDRRWPYKDLFFGDLVKQLAKDATPTIVNDELELMRQVVAEHGDRLETPELRHGLVVELFRRLSLLDFETMYNSPGWRTYIALHATFLSLSDGALRDQVQSALAESEHAHNVRIAHVWQQLTAIFGYRLRPELGATFEMLATLLSATMRGLIIMALSTPAIAWGPSRGEPVRGDWPGRMVLARDRTGLALPSRVWSPTPRSGGTMTWWLDVRHALRTWEPRRPDHWARVSPAEGRRWPGGR